MSGVGKMLGSSCAAASSAGFSATSVPEASATYHCKFQKRSLDAFRIRKRYSPRSQCDFGYAVPLTTGVSLKCSIPTDRFGVPGISGGWHQPTMLGSQVAIEVRVRNRTVHR